MHIFRGQYHRFQQAAANRSTSARDDPPRAPPKSQRRGGPGLIDLRDSIAEDLLNEWRRWQDWNHSTVPALRDRVNFTFPVLEWEFGLNGRVTICPDLPGRPPLSLFEVRHGSLLVYLQ